MVERRVAMEDLNEQPADQGVGGQAAGPPAVARLQATSLDDPLVEVDVEVLSDRAEGVIKESMHRRGLRKHGCVITP